MSDTTTFGSEVRQVGAFVSVEHGTGLVTITCYEFHLQRASVHLTPVEAIALAEDLLRRARAVQAQKEPKT